MYQYRQRAKPGYYYVDGRRTRFDSKMESEIVRRLSNHGFKDKWRRPRGGLAYGFSHYSPDVELCILHDSMNRRALVEFKAFSASEFTTDRRKAMLGVAHFYHDALCFLYVNQTQQWYLIDIDGSLLKTAEPIPGGITIDQLPKPRIMVPIYNRYGRRYWTRPHVLLAKKTADGLNFIVKAFFYTPRKSRRK